MKHFIYIHGSVNNFLCLITFFVSFLVFSVIFLVGSVREAILNKSSDWLFFFSICYAIICLVFFALAVRMLQ